MELSYTVNGYNAERSGTSRKDLVVISHRFKEFFVVLSRFMTLDNGFVMASNAKRNFTRMSYVIRHLKGFLNIFHFFSFFKFLQMRLDYSCHVRSELK